ncbi:MAG: glycosyltransferase family 39 protein [Aureispira sp.]|nr:glycosyltransferase family 39 protein [Aureispira sp.]
MTGSKHIEINPTLLLSLGVIYLLSVALFGFMYFQTDTPSYVNATKLLFGFDAEVDRLHRLVKPSALLIPGLFYMLFELPVIYGLFMQQFCCYFLSGILLYNIFLELFKDKGKAFWGTLLLFGCQPMAIYGVAYLVDGLGWFFGLLGIWMGIRILLISEKSYRHFLWVGFWVGFGFFAKESAAIAGLYLGIHILLNIEIGWIDKMKIYGYMGASFLIIVLGISYFTQVYFGKSMLTWVEFANTDPTYYSWKTCILQTFRTIDVYWVLVVLGVVQIWRKRKTEFPPNMLLHYMLTGLLLLVLLPFVWPYTIDRILFMMSPFILAIAVPAFDLFKGKVAWVVVVGLLLNLGVTFGIYKYELAGWLVKGSLIYIGFLVLLAFLSKREATPNHLP